MGTKLSEQTGTSLLLSCSSRVLTFPCPRPHCLCPGEVAAASAWAAAPASSWICRPPRLPVTISSSHSSDVPVKWCKLCRLGFHTWKPFTVWLKTKFEHFPLPTFWLIPTYPLGLNIGATFYGRSSLTPQTEKSVLPVWTSSIQCLPPSSQHWRHCVAMTCWSVSPTRQ